MSEQALQRMEQPQPMALDSVGRKAAIDELLNKVALVMETMKATMKEGEHFGVIPGCGTKPALLKAGAEKLGMVFRIKPNFEVQERDLGKGHREYFVKCSLSDGTQGVGSCSTMESKYRYRQGERTCPECGKATIIVGKKEYGGGFLCFAKKGGCGAKFQDNDERIILQSVGKVEHDNPADYYNTCLKMAKKRAHVDAIITSTACSDIFTQDIEEMVERADATAGAPQQKPEHPVTTQEVKSKAVEPKPTHLPRCTVKMISERQGTKKDGTPWIAWFILLNDGIKDIEVGTFSKTLSGMAQSLAEEENNQCEADIRPGKKEGTWELVSLVPIPEPKETDNVKM